MMLFDVVMIVVNRVENDVLIWLEVFLLMKLICLIVLFDDAEMLVVMAFDVVVMYLFILVEYVFVVDESKFDVLLMLLVIVLEVVGMILDMFLSRVYISCILLLDALLILDVRLFSIIAIRFDVVIFDDSIFDVRILEDMCRVVFMVDGMIVAWCMISFDVLIIWWRKLFEEIAS